MAFTIRPAVREQLPLLIGIVSKSSGGKTYSALRLASGIQSVVGGEVVGIDTEANRMLHYADEFKFQHLSMPAPFSSTDYLEAIKAALAIGAKTIIIDSMSHEHDGIGGYLDLHEAEVTRLCKPRDQGGGGFSNEYAAQIPAWAEPSKRRRKLISFLVQTPCNFILCFRAKDKIEIPKRVKGQKSDPITHPNQPVAGEEYVFEMVTRFLLLPGSNGIPDWSEPVGPRRIAKMSNAVAPIFSEPRALDEWTGRQLARWAQGGSKKEDPPPPAAGAPTDGGDASPSLDDVLSVHDGGDIDLAADMARGLSAEDRARYDEHVRTAAEA